MKKLVNTFVILLLLYSKELFLLNAALWLCFHAPWWVAAVYFAMRFHAGFVGHASVSWASSYVKWRIRKAGGQ